MPNGSTSSESPGCRTVVDACSSISAGAIDPIAGEQGSAVPGCRIERIFAKAYRPHSGIGSRWRRSVTRIDFLQDGFFEHAGDGDTQADDLAPFVGRTGAVANIVDRIEPFLDCGAIFIGK